MKHTWLLQSKCDSGSLWYLRKCHDLLSSWKINLRKGYLPVIYSYKATNNFLEWTSKMTKIVQREISRKQTQQINRNNDPANWKISWNHVASIQNFFVKTIILGEQVKLEEQAIYSFLREINHTKWCFFSLFSGKLKFLKEQKIRENGILTKSPWNLLIVCRLIWRNIHQGRRAL